MMSSISRWFRPVTVPNRAAGQKKTFCMLHLEALEDRVVPAGFNFANFSDPSSLTLLDDAATTSDQALRLSPAIPKSRGNVWFTEKQFVSVGFETTFDFRLTGGGDYGLAFVVQNESVSSLGRQSAGMGYEMIANSLAVEFDTSLTANWSDPNDNHVSVQTNGTGYNAQNHLISLGWANPGVDLNDGSIHTAKISYVAGSLSVYVDDLANPLLTVAVDLSETLKLDLGRAWVGLTSSSGNQNHDVLNWEYHTLLDPAQAIGVTNVAQAEGNGGTTDFTFTVTRLGDTSDSATLLWSSADGSAASGADYVASGGQVTFAPGVTEQTFTVSVYGDTSEEANETFLVNLTLQSGSATLVDGKAVGTILNDDVTMSIADATALEGNKSWRFIDEFVPAVTSTLVQPIHAVFGPDGKLYVGSRLTDDVHRFDGTTGAFIDVFAKTVPGFMDDPRGLAFGPDGNFYVACFDARVRRYDGTTGAYIDDFVTAGSGGLDNASGLEFGPDGNLYVGNRLANEILRFNGTTGAFIDAFVAAGNGLQGPQQMVFHDGILYVTNSGTNEVLRYNATTGAFLGAFVSAGSGGLSAPMDVAFGSDGDLYVTSFNTNEVLRYNGATGAFVEQVASQTNGGLTRPYGLVFGADGMLYVVGQQLDTQSYDTDNPILRYGTNSLAVFTVTLSTPAGVPVTVNYSTANGTAFVGSDYTAVSGTLTFAPGETTRTILVSTVDNTATEPSETFTVNLSNAFEATISDGQGVGTIFDNETKFFVVNDATTDQTYNYAQSGNSITSSTLGSGNTAPRGVASNAAGTTVWVVDANKKVYVYNPSGGLLGSWTAGSLVANATVEGIATNGTDIWIVDSKQDKVFKYTGAATRLSGSQNAASSFDLNSGNKDAKDIVTDGANLWVVNDTGTDKVFKYTVAGGLLGSWTITGAGSQPTGITIDPTNVAHMWIVDSGSDRVYQYDNAASRTSGSQSASMSFALAAGNTNPQGIADPPTGSPSAIDIVFSQQTALRDSKPVTPVHRKHGAVHTVTNKTALAASHHRAKHAAALVHSAFADEELLQTLLSPLQRSLGRGKG